MLYKWTTTSATPCPSCQLLDGHIHSMEDWTAAGLLPGCDLNVCGKACKCNLAEVDDNQQATTEDLNIVREAIVKMVEGGKDDGIHEKSKPAAAGGGLHAKHEEAMGPEPLGEGKRDRGHVQLSSQVSAAGQFEIACITAGIGNGWEFPAEALRSSLKMWDGVQCFVDHSWDGHSLKDLAGIIYSPAWDESISGITAKLRPVGPGGAMVSELGSAMLGPEPKPSVGFSADVLFTAKEKKVKTILKVLSVDLVLDPARGGAFLRALNSINARSSAMADEKVTNTAGGAAAGQLEKDTAAIHQLLQVQQQQAALAAEAEKVHAVRAQMCEYMLTSGLGASKLPQAAMEQVRKQFAGKVFEPAELNAAIDDARALVTALTGGMVVNGPGNIRGMFTSEDQLQVAVEDLLGASRDKDKEGLKAAKLSGIRELYMMLTGDVDLHGGYHPEHARLATTADFTGLVKNALNKMVVSKWEELGMAGYDWWQKIAVTEHFNSLNTITGTLVGTVGALPAVAEGGEYTELAIGDSPETANFTKYGGYIPLTLELIDRDQTHKLRAYPGELASAGLRKISALVAAIFTQASGVGPTMADTGALFNSTAVTTAGGHANLLTTALSGAQWEVVGTAIYNQPMLVKQAAGYYGTGPIMALSPRYCLVPRPLRLTAHKILYPEWENNSNIHSDNMQKGVVGDVLVVPDWTDVNDWAAVVDPRLSPSIFVGERFGIVPQIFIAGDDQSPAVFMNDESRLKVRHFLAVWVNDFRPLHKENV